MKTSIFTLLMIVFITIANAQSDKAIFLHHSTGGAVYGDGGVEQWITDYNTQNGTNYSTTEFAYPNDPWGWENYPYDYWKLWVDGSCNNDTSNIQCLDQLAENYELIIFKHCFPGAGIGEDASDGDITSANKTIPNYKLQYRALLALMDQYPNTKFMVWTLAPLHRLATSPEQAQLAAQFVDWVKNTWLTEDGESHSNVIVFDFFGLVAEQSASPAHGVQYCLKYDYEGSHTGDDSHPNTTANEMVGPIFAQAIVDFLAAPTSVNKPISITSSLELRYDGPSKSICYKINGNQNINSFQIEVYSMLGKKIKSFETKDNSGLININENGGVFVVRVKTEAGYICRKVVL